MRRRGQRQVMQRRQCRRDLRQFRWHVQRTSGDIFNDQRAQRQIGAGRQHPLQTWRVAGGAGATEAGCLIAQIVERGQAELALLGDPRQPAAIAKPDMVMGQTGRGQRVQVRRVQGGEIGIGADPRVQGGQGTGTERVAHGLLPGC